MASAGQLSLRIFVGNYQAMPHHKGTETHEDAQISSVLLCGFVSLWLVVTFVVGGDSLARQTKYGIVY